jgi:hypothetical protein
MRSIVLALAVSSALSTGAVADSSSPPPPMTAKPQTGLVRGTIMSFDGKQLSIRTASGETINATVSPSSRFLAVESRTFAQLKPTDFIGVTAVDGSNGHLRAEEIHIIPLTGVGEGHYPWDHHPDNASTGSVRAGSMTNGTVETAGATKAGSMTNGMVSTAGANELTMTFRGSQMVDGKCVGHAAPPGGCKGTAIVDVTPATYIAALVPAKPEDVKPGLQAVAGVATTPDGKSLLGSVTVEKNGVKPEF